MLAHSGPNMMIIATTIAAVISHIVIDLILIANVMKHRLGKTRSGLTNTMPSMFGPIQSVSGKS